MLAKIELCVDLVERVVRHFVFAVDGWIEEINGIKKVAFARMTIF